MPFRETLSLLDRIDREGGPKYDDRIDRYMTQNWPGYTVARYRFWKTKQYELNDHADNGPAKTIADNATAADLKPFTGAAWEQRKRDGLAFWHTLNGTYK